MRNSKYPLSILVISALSANSISAQIDRGVGVKVKIQRTEITEEVRL